MVAMRRLAALVEILHPWVVLSILSLSRAEHRGHMVNIQSGAFVGVRLFSRDHIRHAARFVAIEETLVDFAISASSAGQARNRAERVSDEEKRPFRIFELEHYGLCYASRSWSMSAVIPGIPGILVTVAKHRLSHVRLGMTGNILPLP